MRDVQADKELLADTAAKLRHDAIQERYRTGGTPDVAFGIASILDMLEIRARDLPEDLCAELAERCATVVRDEQ